MAKRSTLIVRRGTLAVLVWNIAAVSQASGHACREQNRDDEFHGHSSSAGAHFGGQHARTGSCGIVGRPHSVRQSKSYKRERKYRR